ncbi:MAG: glycoside hydrolase family 31 protein [Anaerolineae bacterium]|nr:glycoside hydrolase family 31 protein [Anaerolineae bacterium]
MTLAQALSWFQVARDRGLAGLLNGIRYHRMMAAMARRYPRPRPSGPFQTPGRVLAVEEVPNGVALRAERAAVELIALGDEVLRVRLSPAGSFAPLFSYAVIGGGDPPRTLRILDEGDAVLVQTARMTCRASKADCRLTLSTADGRVLSEDAEGLAWRGDEVRWSRRLPSGESCHGLGERASSFDLRGKRLTLWNNDPGPAYPRDADPIYTSIPFYVGVQGDLACGFLWDNPARGAVDLGADDAGTMAFSAEEGELCLYALAGPTLPDVLRQFTALVGRAPLPPLWALGFHQSRWGYRTVADFRRLAHEFRARRLPCDVLTFDIDYMDGYRVFTWNRAEFPDLPGLVSELAGQGFKSVGIVDPGIKVDSGYEVYESGLREDAFLRMPDGSLVSGPVWPGMCHFPDFTRPAVRAWWAERVARLLHAVGFAGLWNDMNEPAIIALRMGTTLPDAAQHGWEGIGRSHAGGGHNVYGMLMARATREGFAEARPDARPFVMTRAAYAGAGRYTASWTGDNDATWDHLRLSISMVLNCGLSGMAFTGPDVGGFAGNPDGELFARWMQLASLLPYFRVHSMAGTAPQEPWSYGERVEAVARQALEWRYGLLPTLYSVAAECAHNGLPLVRPLLLADPADPRLHGIDDAYLVGDALLVAPVLEPGAVERPVVLPRGTWYALDSGQPVEGGSTVTADAPLERLPVYVRAGKVLALWPLMQYVGEQPVEELLLRVYAGDGETALYEDAGEGLAYQEGEYRWSYFTVRRASSGSLTIEWRRAGRYEPPYQQVRVEVIGVAEEPEAVQLDGQSAPVWYYENGVVEFITPPFSEARLIRRETAAAGQEPTRPRRPDR